MKQLLLVFEQNLQDELEPIYQAFLLTLCIIKRLFMDMSSTHPLSEKGSGIFEPHEGPGRPKCQIRSEMLEELMDTQWIYAGKVGYSRKYPHTPHGQHWKSCDKCSVSLTGIL